MTVTLNQAAISALLESREGSVGREMERLGESVVEGAQSRVRVIMARFPFDIATDVGLEQREDGSVVVGIRDSGSISHYLAAKEGREGGVWLLPALRDVFPD